MSTLNYLNILTCTLRNSSQLFYVIGSQRCGVHRWVAPTLRALNKRASKIKYDTAELTKRSNFIEWNYKAELFAFAKRLNEEFNMELLQQAFIDRSFIIKESMRLKEIGVENPSVDLNDNSQLIEKGSKLISDYVNLYLNHSLPNVPTEGLKVLHDHLTSDEFLSNVSANIGIKDLILSSDVTPNQKMLANAFKSVITALHNSNSNEEKTRIFIRDFVCMQLNQKNVFDIWEISNPMEMLENYCKQNKLNSPEPRLIGEAAKNTILAAYNVGIYIDKKLVGSGFGESIPIAVDCAALNTLGSFFGVEDSIRPSMFKIIQQKMLKEKTNTI